MSKEDKRSIVAIVIVLLIAGGQGGHEVSGAPVYALCVGVAFFIQWLAFVPAYLYRTEKFYDSTT